MLAGARKIVAAIVVAAAAEAAAGAPSPSPRAALLQLYGLDLIDRAPPEHWTESDARVLLSLTDSLPEPLRTIATRTRFGRIRLLKTFLPEDPTLSHEAPPLLHWQMELHVDRTDPLSLPRAFVHQLLHAFDAHTQTSAQPAWRSLSGWRYREYLGVKIPLIPREADNQDPRAYANERGMRSPAEDFATFGEHFLVGSVGSFDSDDSPESLACRAPEKLAFFRRLFPAHPYPDVQCPASDTGFLDDLQFIDPILRTPMDLGPINADTVTGFELLYATPGVADAAEIAGHLVLRMRLANNPQAERLGIENPNDLVLSFLADTDAGMPPRRPRDDAPPPPPRECKREGWLDFGFGARAGAESDVEFDAMRSIVQSLKGLGGGFLTTFDRQTLWQTVKTYTVDQDRNLLRYRLNLTPEQKRRLIERLYLAKKSYKAKYYFFDRNCASILVQLIGEGIGDDEVAGFDPFVVPPNALVALLIRKGLATPIHPAFYSYRKKGLVAREMVAERLAEARAQAPQAEWPTEADLVSRDDAVRARAFARIETIGRDHERLRGTLFQLAAFGQEAELVYVDKSAACEEVATEPTTVLRGIQRGILAADPTAARRWRVDTNTIIHDRFRGDEERDSRTGSPHTALSSVHLGAGARAGDPAVFASIALHRQEMGSMTTQAMQRATFVTLGQVDVTATERGHVRAWRMTALSLRKLKERLFDVPAYYEADGALGLGLTVLDARADRDLGLAKTTLLGGEVLANIASTRLYNRYVYASVGAAVEATRLASGGRRTHIALPVRLEGLWTFDDERRWQLRGHAELRSAPLPQGRVEREATGRAQLVYRLPQITDSELLLCADAGYHAYSPSGAGAATTSPIWTLRIGMDWNRW